MTPDAFDAFLVTWREDLRSTLLSDPLGYLGRKYGAASKAIDSQFPDRAVLLAYIRPLTSWSQSCSDDGIRVQSLPQGAQQPDLGGLAAFCFRVFEWSPELVHKKFANIIWPGVCLRMLCQACIYDMLFCPSATDDTYCPQIQPSPRNEITEFRPSCIIKVVRRVVKGPPERAFTLYRASVNGQWLVTKTQSGIDEAIAADGYATNDMTPRDSKLNTSVNVWIPLSVVRDALPLFVKSIDKVETPEVCHSLRVLSCV